MTVLSDYVSGNATITNGSKTVTGSGTGWQAAGFREGDLLYKDGYAGIVDSVTSETAFELVDNWPGPTSTAGAYRLRFMGDGERVTAQARALIELLGNGNLQAFAALVGANETVPMFTGPGSMVLKPLTELLVGLTPRGAWSNVTTYAKGDYVWYLGNTFISKIAGNLNHTPPASAADNTEWMYAPTVAGVDGTDGTNGTDGADGADGHSLIPRGDWSAVTTYAIADYVGYNGRTFISKTAGNLNNVPPSSDTSDANWMNVPFVTPGLVPKGVYSAGTTYAALDFVSYSGRNFVSRSNGNVANTPPTSDTDNASWAWLPSGPAGPGLTPRGNWSNAITYAKGDVIVYLSNAFTSFLDGNLNNTPPATAVDDANWMYLPSGGGTGVTDGDKGDITVSGVGTVWTVDNDAISYAKMQNVSATARVLGRKTAAAGDVEEMTFSDVLDMVGSAAEGDILYRSASGWARLPKGTALQALKQNAALTAPVWSPAREVLSAARTYYVRTDGNDSNDGLANTAGGAFLTLQKAWDTILTIDLNGFDVTIQLADGTYTAGIASIKAVTTGSVIIVGNTTTPANVIVSVTGSDCYSFSAPCRVELRDHELRTTTSGDCVESTSGAWVIIGTGMRFGTCAEAHLRATSNGIVTNTAANYSVVGTAAYHLAVFNGGSVAMSNSTVTITGTPNFSSAFAAIQELSSALIYSNTYSGSATGTRYFVSNNSILQTYGASVTFLPGSGAGLTITGGRYNGVASDIREKLSANRTYYVRTDGNDSNTGLANTAGGAFLTLQKAVDVVLTLDLAVYAVTIQLADGTYTGVVLLSSFILGGSLTIRGNATTPANVHINTSGTAFQVMANANVTIRDMKLSAGGYALWASLGAVVNYINIDFGACLTHCHAETSGIIQNIGSYTISGAASAHWEVGIGGQIIAVSGSTITLTGTPAFSTAFARAHTGGVMQVNTNTFSGAGTGSRYTVSGNAVIQTFGAGATYLPGNAVGTTATGGQYI